MKEFALKMFLVTGISLKLFGCEPLNYAFQVIVAYLSDHNLRVLLKTKRETEKLIEKFSN